MQHWDLLAVDASRGTRDPFVVHSDEAARAVLIVLMPGQELGEHQVKENAWVAVVEGGVHVEAGDERLPPETVVHPGHGPETTLGVELARNPFLAELRAEA